MRWLSSSPSSLSLLRPLLRDAMRRHTSRTAVLSFNSEWTGTTEEASDLARQLDQWLSLPPSKRAARGIFFFPRGVTAVEGPPRGDRSAATSSPDSAEEPRYESAASVAAGQVSVGATAQTQGPGDSWTWTYQSSRPSAETPQQDSAQ